MQPPISITIRFNEQSKIQNSAITNDIKKEPKFKLISKPCCYTGISTGRNTEQQCLNDSKWNLDDEGSITCGPYKLGEECNDSGFDTWGASSDNLLECKDNDL